MAGKGRKGEKIGSSCNKLIKIKRGQRREKTPVQTERGGGRW